MGDHSSGCAVCLSEIRRNGGPSFGIMWFGGSLAIAAPPARETSCRRRSQQPSPPVTRRKPQRHWLQCGAGISRVNRMTSRGEGALTLDQLIAMLAPIVGVEKSHEVVASAVASLGTYDADAVVNLLQASPGVIGIAVRRILRMSPPAQAVGDESPTGVRRREPAPVLASGGPEAAPTVWACKTRCVCSTRSRPRTGWRASRRASPRLASSSSSVRRLTQSRARREAPRSATIGVGDGLVDVRPRSKQSATGPSRGRSISGAETTRRRAPRARWFPDERRSCLRRPRFIAEPSRPCARRSRAKGGSSGS